MDEDGEKQALVLSITPSWVRQRTVSALVSADTQGLFHPRTQS
jgi:hypothetical protein